MQKLLLAVSALVALGASAHAGPSPFGASFDGWKFNHEPYSGATICRAIYSNIELARHTSGRATLAIITTDVPKGKLPDSTLIVGNGPAQLVQAESRGDLIRFEVDDYTLKQVAGARGFSWRVGSGGRITGTASYNGSGMEAYKRMMSCVAAKKR